MFPLLPYIVLGTVQSTFPNCDYLTRKLPPTAPSFLPLSHTHSCVSSGESRPAEQHRSRSPFTGPDGEGGWFSYSAARSCHSAVHRRLAAAVLHSGRTAAPPRQGSLHLFMQQTSELLLFIAEVHIIMELFEDKTQWELLFNYLQIAFNYSVVVQHVSAVVFSLGQNINNSVCSCK